MANILYNVKMNKLFLILIFLIKFFIFNTVYAQEIIETGIDYQNTKIHEKKVKIINPVSILSAKTNDKVIFENNISQDKKTKGYWIAKTKEPDKIILNKKEIIELNKSIYDLRLGISNLNKYPKTITKDRLVKTFDRFSSFLSNKGYLDENGDCLLPDFFITLNNNIDIPAEDNVDIKFAITTSYNEVRLLPTSQKIISNINSKDIDRLQEESIDLGTPVIVLCQTKDKFWSYVVTQTEEGWIQTKNLAFTDKKTFNKWFKPKKLVVAIQPKADIYLDKDKLTFLEYIRMGTKLPYISKKGNKSVCVKIPAGDKNGNLFIKKGYINYNDVSIGYLPYTQRNALTLAFKHLHSPYGWGGYGGEQDCSGYLGQIFNCFGILLPETSVQIIKCGKVINLNKKDNDSVKNSCIINEGMAGITFIYLPGHIMLYIGSHNDKPYVIQSIWGVTAYTEENKKTVSYINRIIVSDLEVGSEVAGNSLIDRVSKFNLIK